MRREAHAVESGATPASRRWYVLVHRLPARPLYLRARIRQRLLRAGAVALKKGVYVLPRRADCREGFETIAREAIASGGEAFLCEATFPDRRTDEALIARFRSVRRADYESLAKAHRGPAGARTGDAALARARKRFEEIQAIDFFDAPGRREAQALLRRPAPPSRRARRGGLDWSGRTWVTRRGVQIDRIGSAWLIRRFIDPDAVFRFIDPAEEPRPAELRFDMVGGDFTHVGDACTFEVLVKRLPNPDPAIRHVAEIVHDIDLKDGKFGRADASGVQRVILGIVLSCPTDEERLEKGFALFDSLRASFGDARARSPIAKEVSQ